MHPFTLVFLAALAVATATRLWLGARHIAYVQARKTAVPAQFARQISLEAHQKAADYSGAKTRLHLAHSLVEAALLLILTLGGGLQALDGLARGAAGPGLLHGMALVVGVVALLGMVEMPLNLYRTFGIEARFGFNQMTPAMFFLDLAKQALLAALFGIPLLFCVLWLMAKMGSHWWLYVWLAWAGFNVLVLAIYPTFIAPWFNKFAPLEEGELKTRIERLLAKCGFKSQGLFVMDGSKRSSHGNAYFTGFGRAKRIVFFDTLIARLEPAEVEAVLAHELGHFKLRHVIKRMFWTFAVSLGFLWVLGRLMDKAWFYQGLNVAAPSTAMALLCFSWWSRCSLSCCSRW